MQTHILALSTETPPLSQPQGEVAEKIIKSLSLKGYKAHILRKIFDGSRIEKRHSVVEDYGNALLEGSFFGHAFPDSAPGMTQRNEVYKKEAPPAGPRGRHQGHQRVGRTAGGYYPCHLGFLYRVGCPRH